MRVAAIFFEVSGLADDGDGFQFGGSRHGNKAQEDDLSFISKKIDFKLIFDSRNQTHQFHFLCCEERYCSRRTDDLIVDPLSFYS